MTTSRKKTISERAQAFHDENPHVMVALVETAQKLRGLGIEKLSIQILFERLRWLSLTRTSGDKYRLNNSYCAWYARKIMQWHPEFAGMFVTRESPHDPDFHSRPLR